MDHYFLGGSPFKILALTLFYLYFVKKLGPQLMKNRKPFELKTIMIAYNIFQIISNFIIGGMGLYLASKRVSKSFMCMTIDLSDSPIALLEAKVSHFYFIIKVTDFLDTVFFVLRKKNNQVSFLHIYHHSLMVFGTFMFKSFVPGGQGIVLGTINCYVHVVMYFYYLLTSVNSNVKASLWWKKYITQMQLTQFSLIVIHYGYPLVSQSCTYPKTWAFIAFMQNLFMFILFGDFYYNAYVKKRVKSDNTHKK